MFPRSIRFRRSRAEVLAFSALERALSDDWVVLHHVCWIQREEGRGARDEEADFVLAHPRLGALVVEVKGGELRYDAGTGWTSVSRSGAAHPLDRDPFDQAKDRAHSLGRFLRSLPGWPKGWGPIGYAVCFPDAVCTSPPLPHMGPVLLDARHLADDALRARLEEIARGWAGPRDRPGPEGVEAIVRALAHDVEIRHPLALDVAEADREILGLSDQQFRLLDMLAGNRRVAVAGPAGSGKTLLAAEKARRLAAQGFRVLFTCFNRPLADHLRAALADAPGIHVDTFHGLAVALAGEAGIELRGDRGSRGFWEEVVPRAFERAVDRLGPRYDALIVDEAQDLAADWWVPLQLLLEDPDRGILYAFYDDNQAIYREPKLPEGLARFRLSEVWRNTEQIFAAVKAYYRGEGIVCVGPGGPDVEVRGVAPERLRDELSRVLHRLVAEEGLDPRDLVVLTPHAADHSAVRGRVGAFVLTEEPRGGRDVLLSSIHRFKGLDAPAVVVCEVNRYEKEGFTRNMYVACSRARTLLVVLFTDTEGGEAVPG
ncbi:MAG TPA: NERD domain-containing protein [Actinomycetota bacterium]|nr:NERD domain-containing protein [Actinomycetota bacterium]